MKEKALWILDFISVLSDIHIDLPDYADEDGIDLDYEDIKEIVEKLKECVEDNFED